MFLLSLLLACPTPTPSTDLDPLDTETDTADTGTQDTGSYPSIVEEPGAPLVDITGPNYGQALGTGSESITLVGIAADTVTELSWENGDQSGEISIAAQWTAADLPLFDGDNLLVVTARTEDGDEDQVSLRVSYSAGSPLEGSLGLSTRVAFVDELTPLSARIALSGPADTVVVGPTDEDGELLETWITLEQDGAGLWSGSADRSFEATGFYELRAVAQSGEQVHRSPVREFEVSDVDVAANLDAINALLDDAEAAQATESDALEGLRAAQRILAADPRVLATLLNEDGYSVEAVWESGEHFGLLGPRLDHKGGGALSGLDYSGAFQARTDPREGLGARMDSTMQHVWTNDVAAVAPWADEFGENEVAPLIASAAADKAESCPQVKRTNMALNSEADLDATENALFGHGMVHISSHGTTRRLRPRRWRDALDVNLSRRPQGLVLTREEATAQKLRERRRQVWGGVVQTWRWRGRTWFVWSGPWVQDLSVQKEAFLQNSIVFLDACNTGTGADPVASLMLSGASNVQAVRGSVATVQALYAGAAFWDTLFEGKSTSEAVTAMMGQWEQTDASVQSFGDETRMRYGGTVENGGFEDGLDPWIGGAGDGPQAVAAYKVSGRDFTPYAGNLAGQLYLKDGRTKTYASARQKVCARPGDSLTINFSYRVVTFEAGTCAAANPQYLGVRFDQEEERVTHYSRSWAELCAAFDESYGDWRMTPWTHEELEITVGETETPELQYLSFATGGYGTDHWVVLIDEVSADISGEQDPPEDFE